jgi:hypothetical protein
MFSDGIGGLGIYGKVTPELAAQLQERITGLWQHSE